MQALLNNMIQNIQYIASNPTAGLSLQQYKNSMPTESIRMAIAVLVVIPIACVYPFFQRYFISGLTVGAVKDDCVNPDAIASEDKNKTNILISSMEG